MSDIRHILFICSWYPNREAPALGIFIQQHAVAASAANIVSAVYARSTSSLEQGETELVETQKGNLTEFVVYYGKIRSKIPMLSALQKRDAYIKNIRFAVDKAIQKNEKPDLIHVNIVWPAAIATLPLLSEFNCPVIISENWSGYLPEDGNYRGIIQKNFSKKLADKSTLITVVSNQMEKAMRAHGLGKKFIHLPNTVDTSIFHPSNGSHRSGTIRLLHVSMLVDREKNVTGMLRALSNLEKNSPVELHIIGSGNDEPEIKQLAKELRLDHKVFFHGFKASVQIAEMMNASDALIMFSHYEGMPVTIIEAQCCGLPVIATKVGAIPEMVSEDSGILVDKCDEQALTAAIARFVREKDNFNREQISRRAIERYSLQHVGEKLNGIYSSILNNAE